MKREDTIRALQYEIDKIELNIAIANAAKVGFPLENYDSRGEPFPINLGKKALQEKLKILKKLSPEKYNPNLIDLEVKIKRLEGLHFKVYQKNK
ncbi:hypothetical protein [Aeromonas jandaei]|uniref:hypothetical protein n=1 Tax=Aeromonas jandaei TaxID=650 RepID=UPI003BA13312